MWWNSIQQKQAVQNLHLSCVRIHYTKSMIVMVTITHEDGILCMPVSNSYSHASRMLCFLHDCPTVLSSSEFIFSTIIIANLIFRRKKVWQIITTCGAGDIVLASTTNPTLVVIGRKPMAYYPWLAILWSITKHSVALFNSLLLPWVIKVLFA